MPARLLTFIVIAWAGSWAASDSRISVSQGPKYSVNCIMAWQEKVGTQTPSSILISDEARIYVLELVKVLTSPTYNLT